MTTNEQGLLKINNQTLAQLEEADKKCRGAKLSMVQLNVLKEEEILMAKIVGCARHKKE